MREFKHTKPDTQHRRLDLTRSTAEEAVRKAEEVRTRLAYLRHPDTESEADDWSNAELWEPIGAAPPSV